MEDILYINDSVYISLRKFCSEDLINVVFDSFRKYGEIVHRKSLETHPYKVWVISNFVKENNCSTLHKWFVISTFSYIGGIVRIDERNFMEYTELISFCVIQGWLNEEILEIINDYWYNFNMNNINPQFTL